MIAATAGAARADDDCGWNVIGRSLQNVGDGGGNCPDGQITTWCEVYFTEEDSCTGAIQTVDSGNEISYCVPEGQGFDCPSR